jgi:hypothetical protein
VRQQRGLDLARLDAEAAHLCLPVDAAQELQLAAGSQRTRSPVRYARAPGSPESASGTNAAAVGPGRPR